jgi:chorismate mutase
LAWLQEVKNTFGINVATEVATPEHAEQALKAGIDYLWIGARTSANPIAVQAIAEAIGQAKGILIKNPVNADADLWLGNIERLEKTGLPVIAVHRGCEHKPCWKMAHAVRKARPDVPMLLDPSHLSGDAAQVPELMKKVPELGLNGAMIEVHPNPAKALSDDKQQLTPEQLIGVIGPLSVRCRSNVGPMSVDNEFTELNWLRAEIDELDAKLWDTIADRMDVSRRIGEWKKANHIRPLQPQRYQQILSQRQKWAEENNIDADFVAQLFDIIHQQSLKQQL